ncbi:hypothetical protein JZ751_018316 [Albula glossodonta]|uniref:Palmitoyltransferase ZDHHC7 n=1 Tax=Albula glossodonta TaxID=121402 RepID=A0A8T2NX31_9TELE|nr:hypothetical protein JZ751_018316 [Albula glossodonta]
MGGEQEPSARTEHHVSAGLILTAGGLHVEQLIWGRMQSSGHRLRDVEQHHPLLGGEEELDGAGPGEGERVWFIQDGCGMVCAFMTWFLVLYADFVVTFVMLLPSKNFWYALINGVAFNCLAILALTSHLRTMLTDPGAVPKGNATKEYMDSLQLKPGEMYIALISTHALVLSGFQFFTCVKVQWSECSDFSPPVAVMLMIFLCLEGLLFLTFTAVMFGTQIHSICNDETEIERLKNEKPTWERRVRWEGMKTVFGGQPSLLWINPFAGLRLRRLLTTRSRRGGPEFSV